MNETIQYYDQNAEAYFSNTVAADMSLCRNKFMQYLPKQGMILDAGCGSGRDSKVFLDNGYKVEAIDGSEKLCELASAYLGQEVKHICFEDMAYEACFDGIWACASLLHISKSELPVILQKFHRALKDSGILYASFKLGEGERTDGGRSFSDFTQESARKLLEDAGFQVLECFVSGDVRADRSGEKWVNVYVRKGSIESKECQMVLLVVDTQKGIMDDRLYAFEKVRDNISLLIDKARESKTEVIFVRHDDGPGTGFSVGDDDFGIFPAFEPQEGERIFDKTVNSALHPSVGLASYLDEKGVKSIMVVGLQTDFCIDATIKTGFDKGFQMIVPEYTNSTFDNDVTDKETAFRYFNDLIWPDRYAEVVAMEIAVEMLGVHNGQQD